MVIKQIYLILSKKKPIKLCFSAIVLIVIMSLQIKIQSQFEKEDRAEYIINELKDKSRFSLEQLIYLVPLMPLTQNQTIAMLALLYSKNNQKS